MGPCGTPRAYSSRIRSTALSQGRRLHRHLEQCNVTLVNFHVITLCVFYLALTWVYPTPILSGINCAIPLAPHIIVSSVKVIAYVPGSILKTSARIKHLYSWIVTSPKMGQTMKRYITYFFMSLPYVGFIIQKRIHLLLYFILYQIGSLRHQCCINCTISMTSPCRKLLVQSKSLPMCPNLNSCTNSRPLITLSSWTM